LSTPLVFVKLDFCATRDAPQYILPSTITTFLEITVEGNTCNARWTAVLMVVGINQSFCSHSSSGFCSIFARVGSDGFCVEFRGNFLRRKRGPFVGCCDSVSAIGISPVFILACNS